MQNLCNGLPTSWNRGRYFDPTRHHSPGYVAKLEHTGEPSGTIRRYPQGGRRVARQRCAWLFRPAPTVFRLGLAGRKPYTGRAAHAEAARGAPDKRIDHIYFFESGFASVVANGRVRRPMEIALIGREGMTGLAVSCLCTRSSENTVQMCRNRVT